MAAKKEERHVDRDHQPIPLSIGHAKAGERQDAPGNSPVFGAGLTAEKNGAGVAGAGEFSA